MRVYKWFFVFFVFHMYGNSLKVADIDKDTYASLFESVYYAGQFSIQDEIVFHYNNKPFNGQLLTNSNLLIGNFENGLPQGMFKLYDVQTDEMVCQGIYLKGNKQGLWKKFFDNNLIEEQQFVNGQAEGINYQYGPKSGKLYRKGFYKANLKHGDWVYFYKNGKVFCDGRFEAGVKKGIWRRFEQNGHLQKAIHYNDSLPYLSRRFHVEGYKEVEAECQSASCEFKEYYKNGQLKVKLSYINVYADKLIEEDYVQVYKYNYDDYIKDENFIKHHLIMDDEGLHDYLFNDGLLVSYAISFYGYRDGLYREYYPDGNLKVKGQFKKNKMVGLWVYYKPDGQEDSSIVFDYNMVVN